MSTTPTDDGQHTIGGVAIDVWDTRWTFVDHGFQRPQTNLRHRIGLFAAKQGDQFMYIGAAADRNSAGLSGGLARAYHKNASGDKGSGMKMLRQQRDHVEAYVIDLPRSSENMALIEELKDAMIDAHKPLWNQSKDTIRGAVQSSYKKDS